MTSTRTHPPGGPGRDRFSRRARSAHRHVVLGHDAARRTRKSGGGVEILPSRRRAPAPASPGERRLYRRSGLVLQGRAFITQHHPVPDVDGTALGWRYVGMSQIRSLCVPGSVTEREEWIRDGDLRRAADISLDLEMDHRLKAHIERLESPVVVDVWLQPWLCELSNATRVWLGSDFESRVLKASVSRLRSGLDPSPSISTQNRRSSGRVVGRTPRPRATGHRESRR
jgi:hypothetical protein